MCIIKFKFYVRIFLFFAITKGYQANMEITFNLKNANAVIFKITVF